MTDIATSQSRVSQTPEDATIDLVTRQLFPGLLRQKITVPDRVAGFLHRAELEARAMPTRRRLTVLSASGGFGKTTLLAECCRRLQQDGIATAWVTLDEQDEPDVLDTYIAFACQSAGLNLHDVPDPEKAGAGPESRVGLVVREIRRLRRPFVIAFDELERLTNPASVALLEFLLQRGPSNLHLAMTCRQVPDGLGLAGALLDGCARVIATEELRFSQSEVDRFFDLRLTRGELAAEVESSAGWPFALSISRHRAQRERNGRTSVVKDFVDNWLETRLIADLGPDDREFLLDIGLFSWVDSALLDEVLRSGDSAHRLKSMRVLAGLLEPRSEGVTESWRLHPLVREHCVKRRFRDTPERFRSVHRRIAEALVRRGETVPAMRHAIESGEPLLAGDILERAGGVRLWVRHGPQRFRAADRILSDDIIAVRPRLAMVRCVALLMSGNVRDARELYGEVTARHPEGYTDANDADLDYLMDDCAVRVAFAVYASETAGPRIQTVHDDFARLLASGRLDPLQRSQVAYGLCVLSLGAGEFDTALKWREEARLFMAGSPYLTIFGDLIGGQVAMAHGRVPSAESHYRKAQRIARKTFVLDPVSAASAEVLLTELSLECDRCAPGVYRKGVPRVLISHGAPFSMLAAASGVAIESRLRNGRTDEALAAADELLDLVRGTGLRSLERIVAAMRTTVLVVADRIDDAEWTWRINDLPRDSGACADLSGQSWREMEAVSCARLRYLIATGRQEEGRDLAQRLRTVAIERHLRRTWMRALTLAMVLEQRAGDSGAAIAPLEEYLALFAETPYAWSLVQEREVCAPLIASYLEGEPEPSRRQTARALLSVIERAGRTHPLALSKRERQVLRRLASHRDKQIADALGLTVHGVRYHLRKLFARMGVTQRADAVRRARALGLLPDDT